MNPNRINNEININNPENKNLENLPNQQQEKYKQVEIDPNRWKQQHPNLLPLPVLPQKPVQAVPAVDPVQQVKQMISAGYTPSAALIKKAADLLDKGKLDWSDTWFSLLLKRLAKMTSQ